MEMDKGLHNVLWQIRNDINYPQNECTESLSEYEIQTNLILETYNSMNDANKKLEERKINADLAWLLIAHSQNIATYVLNHPMEGHLLKMAIIALSLASRVIDYRDVLVVLSLVFDSASRAGVNLLSLASKNECSILGLYEFDARLPEEKRIECMGYILQYKDGRPYYSRTW